ncbi:MAG: DUF3775 domain-containing protein [Gammaproteobacteria bacterium]|nr:DUF3775 domain-containing protein [Gammaproteobacteria bacterium]
MKALKKSTVEELIEVADTGELDKMVGILVSLDNEQLAEMRALTWMAKDKDTPKHWEALVIEARSRIDDQTARFIATMPDLADTLRKGLELMEASGRI